MRLTIEEAALLQDRFEEYLAPLIGKDVIVYRSGDAFRVEVLGKVKRDAHPDKNTGRPTTITGSHIDITQYIQRTDI